MERERALTTVNGRDVFTIPIKDPGQFHEALEKARRIQFGGGGSCPINEACVNRMDLEGQLRWWTRGQGRQRRTGDPAECFLSCSSRIQLSK